VSHPGAGHKISVTILSSFGWLHILGKPHACRVTEMMLAPLKNVLSRFWEFFYSRAVAPCRLPEPVDVADEQLKINALRIVVGLAALWRTGLVTFSALYYFPPHGFLSCPFQFWLALVTLTFTGLFTLGFLTPVATVGLLLFYNYMDLTLSTATLGTNVFTCCLFFFLFANAGSRLSVDALALKNEKSPLHALTRACYSVIKFPTREQLRAYLWLLFVSYGLTSLGAASHHVSDKSWLTGETMSLLLNSSFLASQWQFFRVVSAQLPWLFSTISPAICVVQILFQGLMIPLVYTRWGCWFVGLYGTGFALGSLILLQLSYLPWTEGVLWALVFCPARYITRPFRRAGSAGEPGPRGWQPTSFAAVATACTLVCFLLFTAVVAGSSYPGIKLLRKAAHHLPHKLYYLGLDSPDVFNRLDLSTGKYWYVMERQTADGKIEHVPLYPENGSREIYHWFDTVCFGNLIAWKRMMGLYDGDSRELLAPGQPCYSMIKSVAEFDRRLMRLGPDTEYRVTVYGAEDYTGKNPHPVDTLVFRSRRHMAHTGANVH